MGEIETERLVRVAKLTPEGFAKFGSVLSADHQLSNCKTSAANQGTAVKLHKFAPVVNNSRPSGVEATINWNIFRCSPPVHLFTRDEAAGITTYRSKVLERHPFSTQMFVPVGCDKSKDAFIVICALNDAQGEPDIDTVEAFICKGNQAVNYGVGTWHAPMVSLVDSLDFAVLVSENGVQDEDCQERFYRPGFRIVFS